MTYRYLTTLRLDPLMVYRLLRSQRIDIGGSNTSGNINEDKGMMVKRIKDVLEN